MLVAAACCPIPPLLVPELAGAAAPELDVVRDACVRAIRRVLGAGPDLVVVVGEGPATTGYDATAGGTFAGYGVPVRTGGTRTVLPLSLTIGQWLLERASPSGRSTGRAGAPQRLLLHGVARNLEAGDCLRLGADLARRAPSVGLVAMGDGSAVRATWAPGHVDEAARELDADAARALGDGDGPALVRTLARFAGPEPERVRVTGRVAWLVLAGAAAGVPVAADLLADTAPYGVTYLVASWLARNQAGG